jgi:hypothetical protein
MREFKDSVTGNDRDTEPPALPLGTQHDATTATPTPSRENEPAS